jgi:tetratricopeptide repeat protein
MMSGREEVVAQLVRDGSSEEPRGEPFLHAGTGNVVALSSQLVQSCLPEPTSANATGRMLWQVDRRACARSWAPVWASANAGEVMLREALEARQRRVDEAHPSLIPNLNALAGTLRLLGRTEGARRLYREAVEIAERQLPYCLTARRP